MYSTYWQSLGFHCPYSPSIDTSYILLSSLSLKDTQCPPHISDITRMDSLDETQKQENRAVHAAHEKHGSIVRLAPNEISVNCVNGGLRTVWGGFDKPDWYPNIFDNYGKDPIRKIFLQKLINCRSPNMFSTTLSKPHSARKRMIPNIYSKSYLHSSPQLPAISQTLIYDRLLPIIQSAGKSIVLDVLELNFAVTMDFINAYLFGLPNGSNFCRKRD
jgi:unspecific monooxygenase